MTWRPKNRDESIDSPWSGLIEKDVRMEGTLHVSGTFRIDGKFKGEIVSVGRLILAENAAVEAEVHAVHVAIAGKFTGKLHAEREVEISSTGRARGEIHTPCLLIEPGGVLDGVCNVPASAGEGREIAIPVRPVSAD
jgi:cytoskeletal protein CcmA (bactofilin family)